MEIINRRLESGPVYLSKEDRIIIWKLYYIAVFTVSGTNRIPVKHGGGKENGSFV